MNNPPPISVLGKEKALALCAEFGGSSIYIPKQETLNRELCNKEIIEEYKNGVSLHQLRKKYQLSETTLRTIIFK
ncbi:MAG: Mor transcription activator family protein [Mucispirillum sp.]|nr:Mor transcription activator family protein [Mucispirillum sp.]